MCSQRVDAYVSLGSNMGDALAQLAAARDAVAGLKGIEILAASPVYHTEPQDMREQPWFANQILRLGCGALWTAVDLLDALLRLEATLGRRRSVEPALRYGPRCIDVDLLLFGSESSTDPHCLLPHPRMLDRAFVLVPLRDIAPEVILSNGETPGQRLRHLPHRMEGQNIYQ